MMFAVEWTKEALDQLADLWVRNDALFRKELTAATEDIDRLLATDPEGQGESRGGGDRICFLLPVAFRFRVDRNRKVARVLRIWSYRRRP